MRGTTLLRVVGAASAVTLALAACSSSGGNGTRGATGAGTPIGTASQSAPSALQTVKLGFTGMNPFHLVILAGEEEHTWEQAGVKLDIVTFQNGAQVGTGLLTGAVDVTSETPEQAIGLALKTPGIKMIAGVLSSSPFSLVAAPSIKTYNDLIGKKLCVNTAGQTSDSINAELMLLNHGIPSGKYHFVNVGADDLTPLLSGAVDATELMPPDIYTAEAKGFRILQKASEVPTLQNVLTLSFAAPQKWLSSHHELAVKFVKGYQDTMKWILSHRKAFAADIAKQFKVSSSFAERAYDYFFTGAHAPNGNKTGIISQESIEKTLKNDRTVGLKIDKSVNASQLGQFYDNSYAKEAMKK